MDAFPHTGCEKTGAGVLFAAGSSAPYRRGGGRAAVVYPGAYCGDRENGRALCGGYVCRDPGMPGQDDLRASCGRTFQDRVEGEKGTGSSYQKPGKGWG